MAWNGVTSTEGDLVKGTRAVDSRPFAGSLPNMVILRYQPAPTAACYGRGNTSYYPCVVFFFFFHLRLILFLGMTT